MVELTYEMLLSKVQEYHFQTCLDLVAYCMGWYGQLDQTHFDMIMKMHRNGIIKE